MSDIKPFMCDTIEKSLVQLEWEKWFRSFKLYLASEEVDDPVKKKNKLLHLGGSQLQEVVYNLPGALVETTTVTNETVFTVLVKKLDEYFSPKRNSTFERHLCQVFEQINKQSESMLTKVDEEVVNKITSKKEISLKF